MPADASAELVVALDIGHGGTNDGAWTPTRLVREADLVLGIGKAAHRKRPSLVLVREQDETLSFRQREQRFQAARADLVISLHLDSTPWDRTAAGTHGYHNKGNAITRHLARFAVNNAPHPLRGGNVIQAFDNPHIRHDNWKRRSQRIVRAYAADTLLLEFGYLSNPENLRYIVSTEGIEACADLVLLVADRFISVMTPLKR